MHNQTGTAFALDDFSPIHFLSALSRRVGTTSDIFWESGGERSRRVDGIDSQSWDEQPNALHGETIELRIGHTTVMERSY